MKFRDPFAGVRLGKPDEWEPFDQSLGIPTRDNCDLENPRQTFLWQYVGLPGVVGAPLVFPIEYWELVSFHQVLAGARLAAVPQIKYRPSTDSMLNKTTAAGEWVDPSEPDPTPTTLADVTEAQIPESQRAELREHTLSKMGFPSGQESINMPVAELATRLKINVDRLVMVLAEFGIENLSVDSVIDRVVAERIVEHMGLGAKR